MTKQLSYRNLKKIIEFENVNPPRSLRSWGRYIREIYEGRCIVTGNLGTKK